ncbi:MAG: DUF4834 domain-containing protein [Coprobacillus sp.]
MGYGWIYLVFILLIVMFLMRFLMPLLVLIFPILMVLYILKILFGSKRKTYTHTTTYDETYYNQQSTNQNQSRDPNVIDVDYTVVDEKEDDTQ